MVKVAPATRQRVIPRAVFIVAVVTMAWALAAVNAFAAESQVGANMVVINPGGGRASNGSDGLQSVFNGMTGYKPSTATFGVATPGADTQFFGGKGQWQIINGASRGGSGPVLNIGGTAYGESGAAAYATPSADANWSSITIVSTSGSAVSVPVGTTTLPSSPTGDGSAVIRYTVTTGGRTYTVERTITYLYPNSYFTDSYAFTIPDGNTAAVKFYLGGDAAPGDTDSGDGLMVLTPRRSLFEVNSATTMYVGYSEVPDATAFDHWFVGTYNLPYSAIKGGTDLSDVVDGNDGHDAGMQIQWSLGSTPGTFSRALTVGANFQQVQIASRITKTEIEASATTSIEFQLVNLLTALDTSADRTGLGFAYTLPTDLVVAGGLTSSCDGTLTNTATTITVTGIALAGNGGNCTVVVPVEAPNGTYTIRDQSITASGGLATGYSVSSLVVHGPPAITEAPDTRTVRTIATFAFKSSGVTSFQCKVDSDVWGTCSSPVTIRSLAAGTHTFIVRPTGDTDTTHWVSYTWKIVDAYGTRTEYAVNHSYTALDVVPLTSNNDRPGVTVDCEVAGELVLNRCVAQIWAFRSVLSGTGHHLIIHGPNNPKILLGTGSWIATKGSPKSAKVNIVLNKNGLKAIHGNLNGFTGTVRVSAFADDTVELKTAVDTRLQPARQVAIPSDGMFKNNTFTLSAKGIRFVRRLVLMIPQQTKRVVCTGYTDNHGWDGDNRWLSNRRAEVICSGLQAAGLRSRKWITWGRGAANPLASNDTEEGRIKNRRVQVSITY